LKIGHHDVPKKLSCSLPYRITVLVTSSSILSSSVDVMFPSFRPQSNRVTWFPPHQSDDSDLYVVSVMFLCLSDCGGRTCRVVVEIMFRSGYLDLAVGEREREREREFIVGMEWGSSPVSVQMYLNLLSRSVSHPDVFITCEFDYFSELIASLSSLQKWCPPF
jgi:hypothetical protein